MTLLSEEKQGAEEDDSSTDVTEMHKAFCVSN